MKIFKHLEGPMIEERYKGRWSWIPNLLTSGECIHQVRTRCGGGKTKVCPSKNGIFKNWKYNLFLKIRNRNA